MLDKSKIKKIAIIILITYILLLISNLTLNVLSPPAYANIGDETVVDIGNDGFLVATIEGTAITSENDIPNGNIQTTEGYTLFWKNAKNISFVDIGGRHGYMIVWHMPLSESNLNGQLTYDYGYVKGSYSPFFVMYNPSNGEIYCIILEKTGVDLFDLIHEILGFSNSQIPYSQYDSSQTGSYGGVDTSPSSIAGSDPDWYYEYYDYGDYDEYDEFLESQGYD